MPVESILHRAGAHSLDRDEFIIEFRLPKRAPRSADAYLRFIPRTEMDIAVVGAGINVTLDAGGVCTDARVVLGAVAPTAVLVPDAADARWSDASSTKRRSPALDQAANAPASRSTTSAERSNIESRSQAR